MPKKVYISGNALIIQDSSTSVIEWDILKHQIYYKVEDLEDNDKLTIIYGLEYNSRGAIFTYDLSDLEDQNGTSYTKTTLRQFLNANLGYLSDSGSIIISNGTGWGSYVDTQYSVSNTFAISGNSTYVNLPNNAGSVLEIQKPEDIDTFYDGSVITGREGDGLNLTISFAVIPKTNQVTRVTVVPDIGGAVGEIVDYARDVSFSKGQNIEQRYLSSFNAYTLDTWEANGATMKIKVDQNTEIYGIRYLLTRTHKAI